MSTVLVSAVRFSSMLANRHWTVEDVMAAVATEVDLGTLAEQDQDVVFEDLQRLARHFKRPWSYLLCDEPERFPDLGQDNRTFANSRRSASPELMVELEACALMLDAAAELFPEGAYEIPPLMLTSGVSPSVAAKAIRAFLGVSLVDQLGAKDGFAALRMWVAALHRRGVYVSQRRLRDGTIRAFSKVRHGQALIVVDTGDSAYARIFSALHEYTHVVLRSAGVCDLDEHSDVERYCNEVAASVLLPDELLRNELRVELFGGSPEADDEQLAGLSHHLRVSQAALLIRLRDRGLISQERYNELEDRRQSRRGRRVRGGTYYAPTINRVGRRFAGKVFGALSEGLVDRQDAAVLLEIGEHLVDRYRRELAKGEDGEA